MSSLPVSRHTLPVLPLHCLPTGLFEQCELIRSYHSGTRYVLLFKQCNMYTLLASNEASVSSNEFYMIDQVFNHCVRNLKVVG